MAKRKVPIKLTLSFDDAYKAYQKGKNTAQEPALLKKLYAAKRAVKRAEEGPYDYKKERRSTSGQRREAARIFGRQEETVEHEGRLQRIPGSVVGPNERFTRVTPKEKKQAADTFSTGVEIASYAIGAGQMFGLIRGAAKIGAKFLTKKAIDKTGKKKAVQLANAATRRANRQARQAADVTKAAKTRTATATMTKAEKAAQAAAKKQAAKLAEQTGGSSTATAQKTAAAAAKKAAAKKLASTKKAAAAKKLASTKKAAASKKAAATAGLSTGEKALIAGIAAGTVTLTAADYKMKKKQAQDITDATARRKALDKIASAEKAAKGSVPASQLGGIGDFPIDKATPPVPRSKTKKTKEAALKRDMTKSKALRSTLDRMSAAERKSLGPVTNFMEKLLGLNRDKAAIERDMAVSKKLDEAIGFSGGKKRGGRVSKPSKKKYVMNRGGKVASVRKPTRA